MKIKRKVIDAHWTFYITLISIICSFTFERFLANLVFDDINLLLILKLIIVFGSIILTWHEYAIGATFYEWKIDIYDSVIPFMVGTSLYFLVGQLEQENTSDFKFFISLAGFSATAIIAYLNQVYKSKRYNIKQVSLILAPNFFKLAISLSVTTMLISILAASIIFHTNINIQTICSYSISILVILIYSYFIFKANRIRNQIKKTLDIMTETEITEKFQERNHLS
jgi:hypothetical protein